MIHHHDDDRHHHTVRNKEGEQEEDLDGDGDGFADEARVGLPRAEPYRGDLRPGVQFKESNTVRHFHAFLQTRALKCTDKDTRTNRERQRKWGNESVKEDEEASPSFINGLSGRDVRVIFFFYTATCREDSALRLNRRRWSEGVVRFMFINYKVNIVRSLIMIFK